MMSAAEVNASLPEGSAALRALFTALTLFVAASFVGGVYWAALRSGASRPAARRHATRAALASAIWIAITGGLAAAGVLHFSAPPTMLPLFPIIIGSAIGFALSPAGRRVALSVPLAALVGFQSFRIGVELLMHRAYTEGLMPVQMSYTGRNFDIITGITAAAAAIWLARGHRSAGVVFAWNTLGLVLLTNILVVALLSTPTPMRRFMNDPANVWVTRAPWIWLPTVFVWAAIAGQVLVYRRLWNERSTARASLSTSISAAV